VTELQLKASAVQSAVFQCLVNAGNDPDNEKRWRNHADLLERKFTTDHGKHYSLVLKDTQ
jgi:hypothetical protein